MSLLEIVKGIEQEVHQRQQEREILANIAAVTSLEFAEQAAEILDNKKHLYSFTIYLVLLK